jgi:poly(A) polymerase
VVPVAGHHIEIATFRQDGAYMDGRHPIDVTFSDAEADARRRDFTINAIFEDPISGTILDFVGGRDDLEARVIRAVGDPELRFAEDHLRLLRAVRFAARFGFDLDEPTRAAITTHASTITQVSAERIGEEVVKILTEGKARDGFELLDTCGLLEWILPEMSAMRGCEQSTDSHPEGDVFAHTMICLQNLVAGCSQSLALGVLLHDIAKPACAAERDGRHTFYGHTKLGGEMAADICHRLRRSGAVTSRVVFLVEQHLRHCTASDMKKSTLKRFLRQEGMDELLELTRIDAVSSNGDLSHYDFCKAALASLEPDQIRPKPLLTGQHLIEMGLAPGPRFKEILKAVEDAQLDGRITTGQDAVELVRSLPDFLDRGQNESK